MKEFIRDDKGKCRYTGFAVNSNSRADSKACRLLPRVEEGGIWLTIRRQFLLWCLRAALA